MVTSAKYHTYGWYLSLPQISQIYTDTLVASNSYHQISMEELRRNRNLWKSVLSVGKLNIQHYNNVYGFTKLHQAGVSPALFSWFVTRGGKCSSDALDLSQSRPSEEASWKRIRQEQQGIHTYANFLYYLFSRRTIGFQVWESMRKCEQVWESMKWRFQISYLCIVIQRGWCSCPIGGRRILSLN